MQREIRFSYWAPRSEQEELDPQPNELDPPFDGGYIGGYLTESSSLLDGISFYTRGQLQSSLEIRYDDVDVDEFDPEPNIHTRPRPKGYVGKYMVDGITRCDRQKVCLPWSRFEWNWSPSEWSSEGEDFAYADQETHPVNGPKRSLARIGGDFDGDGDADQLMVSPSVSEDGLSKWDFWELDPSAPTSPEWTARRSAMTIRPPLRRPGSPSPTPSFRSTSQAEFRCRSRPPSSEPTPLKS